MASSFGFGGISIKLMGITITFWWTVNWMMFESFVNVLIKFEFCGEKELGEDLGAWGDNYFALHFV